MEVTTQTRLQVNSYTAHNVKNKGMIGYQHIKRMLEYMLEDYKEKHYIRSISLNKLRIESGIEASYISFQKTVNYFLQQEGVKMSANDYLVDTLEKIIDFTKLETMPEDEEEF